MTSELERVLTENQSKYIPNAWKDYTEAELSTVVGFFAKRSTHRNNLDKAMKDISDAKNYLSMLEEKLKERLSNV